MITNHLKHFLVLFTRWENTVQTLMIETIYIGTVWGNISPKILMPGDIVADTEVLKTAVSILFALQLKVMNEITRSFYHTLIHLALSFIMICTQISATKHRMKFFINKIILKVILNKVLLLVLRSSSSNIMTSTPESAVLSNKSLLRVTTFLIRWRAWGIKIAISWFWVDFALYLTLII
jgi:hypothetical protein